MHHSLAFLRGINLGGRRVKLDRPAAYFEALAFTGVATFIVSGNVIFSGQSSDGRKLARQIEPSLSASLGYDVDTFVRTHAEVAALALPADLPDIPGAVTPPALPGATSYVYVCAAGFAPAAGRAN